MAQARSYSCPRCGTPVGADQQFCVRCGLRVDSYELDKLNTEVQQPAVQTPPKLQSLPPLLKTPPISDDPDISKFPPLPENVPTAHLSSMPGDVPSAPFPPFPGDPQYPMREAPMPAPAPALPPLASRTRKRSMGMGGVLFIGLLVLIILGSGGYVAYRIFMVGNSTQSAISTTTINTSVVYAGVNVAVTGVQQSENFLDDPNTSSSGMVRLTLQAQNKTHVPVNLMYHDIAHIILPGGQSVDASYVKAKSAGVAPGNTLTSTVDFPVPSGTKVNQLKLRLGAANEAQMDIPLTGQGDLQQYAPKTVQLNGKLEYLGLDWALVSATTQLSIDGQQAGSGMHFVTVTLKVDNTLAQTAITGSPYDYIRLSAGNTTATPVATTLPASFDAGVTGKTGTVTFMVPQNAATLTLILQPQQQDGFKQAKADFKLQ